MLPPCTGDDWPGRVAEVLALYAVPQALWPSIARAGLPEAVGASSLLAWPEFSREVSRELGELRERERERAQDQGQELGKRVQEGEQELDSKRPRLASTPLVIPDSFNPAANPYMDFAQYARIQGARIREHFSEADSKRVLMRLLKNGARTYVLKQIPDYRDLTFSEMLARLAALPQLEGLESRMSGPRPASAPGGVSGGAPSGAPDGASDGAPGALRSASPESSIPPRPTTAPAPRTPKVAPRIDPRVSKSLQQKLRPLVYNIQRDFPWKPWLDKRTKIIRNHGCSDEDAAVALISVFVKNSAARAELEERIPELYTLSFDQLQRALIGLSDEDVSSRLGGSFDLDTFTRETTPVEVTQPTSPLFELESDLSIEDRFSL